LTDAWDYPKNADGPKHEADAKHKNEIEHASFQNLHNSLPGLSAPDVVLAKGFTAQSNDRGERPRRAKASQRAARPRG
jgi:hypothetical protein